MEDKALFHILYATLIFFIIVLIYSLGMFGGGDAKLLAIAFFWFSENQWFNFYKDLMIVTLIYSLVAYFKLIPLQKTEKGTRMPYGPCICIAWAINLVYI